jgi:ABC-type anion transport system duplicated permease subunit
MNERTPSGGAMVGRVIITIILAVIISIILGILVGVRKKPAKRDERDYVFSAGGSMIACLALFIFVSMIIGQVMFQGLCPETAVRPGFATGPLIIAHFLLLSLMFSSTIKCVVQLFFYRRGF